MEYQEFVMTMQMAGATLSNEQISELGTEAHEKFGIDKDAFMLLLLSGREDFRNWIYEQASEKLKKTCGLNTYRPQKMPTVNN